MRYGKIARDEKQFNTFTAEHKRWDRQHAYARLLKDTLVMLGDPSDTTFQNFTDTTAVVNIGLFTQVQDAIDSMDFTAAAALNAGCVPSCIMDANKKQVNEVYLQTWAVYDFELDINQIAILEAIACQDPLEGGDAVYSARVMLGVDYNCQNNYKTGGNNYGQTAVEKENGMVNEAAFVSKLYPNPNNGRMQLDYRLEEGQQGILQVFDITGKLLRDYRLTAGNNSLYINEEQLDNGIYSYRVLIDEAVILNDKLVIVK